MRKEYFNKSVDLPDLRVINCGYEDCCPKFMKSIHIRKYYLIHYVYKGSGYYKAEDKLFTVNEGDAFIIYPDEKVTYYSPDINSTWSFCWIGFDGTAVEKYLNEAKLPATTYVFPINNKRFTANISNCMDYIESTHNNPSQLILNSYLLKALSIIQAQYESENPALTPSQIVERAIHYIEFNYMNGITVKDLCEYLFLDRSYVFRIFKKYTGASPEQYIINYRMRCAIDLMKSDSYTLSQIAESVGINGIYYFSKQFKKVLGVSPSEYRKNLHNS